MNYGLIIPEKIETLEQGGKHVLGSANLAERVINPSGDWEQYAPDREPQNVDGYETNACTYYATNTAFEALDRFLGETTNYSDTALEALDRFLQETANYSDTALEVLDRFLAETPDYSDTALEALDRFLAENPSYFDTAFEALDRFLAETPNYSDRYTANIGYQLGLLDPNVGANPHDTAEVLRKESGQVPEADAPWGTPYYELDTAPLKPKALKWYEKRRVAHKWVFTGGTPEEKRAAIQDALTKGVVCVSVAAWHKRKGVYYKPKGATDNHWVWLMSANKDKPYRIFDSYDAYIKDLDPLYDFSMAKVYFYRPIPFTTNLSYRMTHADVPRLQRELTALGYAIPNGITDFYGQETRRAVWQFQQSVGIADDGSHFGPRTRNALNKKLNPDDYFGGSLSTFLLALFSAS